MKITALDLFAGHGWGVACKQLGIAEFGVEIMPEAIATRTLHGMETIYNDVWEGLADGHAVPEHDLLIASPPCQTFSMAGNSAGRKVLDQVVGLIDSKAYQNVAQLRAFGEEHDPRTALVLTPLTHVYRDLPRYVVLEQVPPVLPVWERMAEEMRAWGYSVWTGVLNAEQYGVPQTRKRAVLMAKRDPELDGEATPPVPTHSRYYSRSPEKLDEGVLPWVSMAEALGWGMTERPYLTVAPGTAGGGTDPMAVGGSGARRPIDREKDEGRWSEGWGYTDRPSPTVTGGGGKASGIELFDQQTRKKLLAEIEAGNASGNGRVVNPNTPLDSIRLTVAEAARLQSYPDDGTWRHDSGNRVWIQGNQKPGGGDEYQRREATEPAPTVTSNASRNQWLHGETGEEIKLDPAKPSPTVAGDPRIPERGFRKAGEPQMANATKVTLGEAAALQSYPKGFEFAGAKGKQFLQVGNAVPPLLARRVLEALLGI